MGQPTTHDRWWTCETAACPGRCGWIDSHRGHWMLLQWCTHVDLAFMYMSSAIPTNIISTRAHTLTHTHTHMHTHTHADTHTNTVHIHAHSCTHTHTHTRTHTHTKTCACMVMGTVCTTYILTVLACMEELRCPLTPLVTLHTWKGLGAGWHKHRQEDLHWIHPLWQVCVHKKLLIKRHRLREEEIKLIIKVSY